MAVEAMLAGEDGVAAKIHVLGGQTVARRLWLDQRQLTAYGMTGEDVAAPIRDNNFQSAPGQSRGLYVSSLSVEEQVINSQLGLPLLNIDASMS
jgi:multidrug efflux pump